MVSEELKHGGLGVVGCMSATKLELVWNNHESNMLTTCDVEDIVLQFWYFFKGKEWLIKDYMTISKYYFTGRMKIFVYFMFMIVSYKDVNDCFWIKFVLFCIPGVREAFKLEDSKRKIIRMSNMRCKIWRFQIKSRRRQSIYKVNNNR